VRLDFQKELQSLDLPEVEARSGRRSTRSSSVEVVRISFLSNFCKLRVYQL